MNYYYDWQFTRFFSGDPDVTDWKKNTNYKSGYGPTHQVKYNLMKANFRSEPRNRKLPFLS